MARKHAHTLPYPYAQVVGSCVLNWREEAFQIALIGETCLKHFDSGKGSQVNMFSQVDIHESSSAKLASEAVIS
jgi:hypothetical protein